MDVFDFMKGITFDLEEVFQSNPTPNVDLDRGFKELQHDMEKQIRIWWDIASLEAYIKKKSHSEETQMGCHSK